MPDSLPPQDDNDNKKKSMDSNPPESMPSGAIGAGGTADVLSREELRELFSPVAAGPSETARQPVLILAETPEDAETLSSQLRECGVQPVLAFSRFMALDLFRERAFQALISTPEAWGEDSAGFLERFRAVDPAIRFCFVCRRGQAPPVEDGLVLERPLGAASVGPLRSFLGSSPARVPPPPVGMAPATRAPAGDRGDPQREKSTPNPAPRSGRASESVAAESGKVPNGFLGVEELLAAVIRGESIEHGLRAWANRDPGILGLITARSTSAAAELHCSYWTRDPAHRPRLIHRGATLLTSGVLDVSSAAVTLDGFFVFFQRSEDSAAGSRWVALWHAGAADRIAEQLAPLMPLLARVAGRNDEGEAAESPRDRFGRLLWSRMKACERQDARLLLLVADSTRGTVATNAVRDALATVLRGADWLECVGDRVYGALDHAPSGSTDPLEARLRAFAQDQELRVVGLGWSPGDSSAGPGAARDWLARADQLLSLRRSEGSGAWLSID